MKCPLRVLHLEDDRNDAELIRMALEADGIECVTTRVETRPEFVAAIETEDVDLVLSDYSLPTFDGLSAARLVHSRWPELPVILVSGTLGEELAIDSMKSGATDYVLKDRLSRLAPAVRRAMQEVEGRAERQLLETQFIEAQKMQVVGQLAAGVAHDFNNILGVIMGYSDLLACELAENSPLRVYTDEIRQATDRAVGLTRQLLVFSRKEAVQPVVLDLNEVLLEMERMLQRLLDDNIEMAITPGSGIGRIMADGGYIGQVMMNLVVNARDVMPNGGNLTIRTSNVSLDEAYARAHPGITAGEYVMLSVTDTGSGMSDEVKAHLFEAFFTTKPLGKGTGLGLATCRTIVQQSGGHINVSSEVGRGSTFEIYFPRIDQPLRVLAKPLPATPLPKGTETILVVEDEPSVRQLTRGVLEGQGYKVLLASNGQDALNVARGHQGAPIRLVVTDMVMPLMGGKVMAEWLKTAYPDIRVLFTSGYAEAAISAHGLHDEGVEFIAKPYSLADLVCKVRELLDFNGPSSPVRDKQILFPKDGLG